MAWRRTDYLDQYRSSETISLRPTDILQLNKTKRTFHQVQFIRKPTRLQILQEHKYYTECMRTIYILQNRSSKLGQTDDIRHPAKFSFHILWLQGPDETKHGIWKTVFCVLWSTSARSHLGGLEKNNSIIFRLVEILSGWQHVSAMRSYDCFLVVITVIPNYTFGCCRNDNVYHSMDK